MVTQSMQQKFFIDSLRQIRVELDQAIFYLEQDKFSDCYECLNKCEDYSKMFARVFKKYPHYRNRFDAFFRVFVSNSWNLADTGLFRLMAISRALEYYIYE